MGVHIPSGMSVLLGSGTLVAVPGAGVGSRVGRAVLSMLGCGRASA